jgi:hypothetical protein
VAAGAATDLSAIHAGAADLGRIGVATAGNHQAERPIQHEGLETAFSKGRGGKRAHFSRQDSRLWNFDRKSSMMTLAFAGTASRALECREDGTWP